MKTVLMACAYFDWFSNYQEVALANALKEFANVHVIASNRINPIFSDANIRRLNLERTYRDGTTRENGITISRFKVREIRSMSASVEYMKAASSGRYDMVIQVTPGFILPAMASWPKGDPKRIVLYGDNSAMYKNLSPLKQKFKQATFFATKGLVYRYCNSKATAVYCYTPDTIGRIKPFLAGAPAEVLPLSYDPAVFFYSDELRQQERRRLGFAETDTVLVTAGKAYHTKRIDLLVEAFDRLASRYPNLHLVIAGMLSGSGSESVRAAINASPYRDRITSLPILPANELNSLLNASDIGTWPLMPAITIQQAMGTGLPVILPKNDLVGHLLRSEDSGTYYAADFNTPYALGSQPLSDAIDRVLKRPRVEGEARRNLATKNSWLSSRTVAASILSRADSC